MAVLIPQQSKKFRKPLRTAARIVSAGICVFSSFILACLLFLNYYYNCSIADCTSVHATFAPFYTFDFDYVFPVTRMVPVPYIVILFVECAYLFLISIGSFAIFRAVNSSLKGALIDAFEFGCAILVLFELGILLIDPDWRTVHVTGFIFYPLSLVTNEELLVISSIALAAVLIYRHRSGLFPELKTLKTRR